MFYRRIIYEERKMGKKIIGGWRNYESRIYGILHILILLLSVFLIITISIDTFHNISFLNQGNYMEIQLWICSFFMFDFWLEFVLSDHKWKYLRNRFIFFLVSIPYLNIFSYLNLNFSSETYYFLRFIPLVRSGYALAIVVGWLSYNKISSLFISYVTMLMATVYFSSLIFFVLEHAVNPMVTRYTNALWWAFMDVTTSRFEHLCRYRYRKDSFGRFGCIGYDDVPYFYGLCDEPIAKIQCTR